MGGPPNACSNLFPGDSGKKKVEQTPFIQNLDKEKKSHTAADVLKVYRSLLVFQIVQNEEFFFGNGTRKITPSFVAEFVCLFFSPTTDMNNPKIIVAYIVLVFWRDSSQRDNERSYITVGSLLRKKKNALSMNQ